MTQPSFDEFAVMLDEAIDRIPAYFVQELSGGFNLQKQKKRDGDYYIMGEYIEDGLLGCFIEFYYGSFVELLRNESLDHWRAEIVDTVLHEMRHHLESLAGRDDLARSEMEELARALRDE